MKPTYAEILSNFPSVEGTDRTTLFNQMGWSEFLERRGYQNTCAIRMSIALQKSGIDLPHGGHRFLDGELNGKRLEVRQKVLYPDSLNTRTFD